MRDDTDYRATQDLDQLLRHTDAEDERCLSCEALGLAENTLGFLQEGIDQTCTQSELAYMQTAALCVREVLTEYFKTGTSVENQWPVVVEYLRRLLPLVAGTELPELSETGKSSTLGPPDNKSLH